MSYCYGEKIPRFLSKIHSFGKGWAIADETGIYCYRGSENYERLFKIRIEKDKDGDLTKQESILSLIYLKEELEARFSNPKFHKEVSDDGIKNIEQKIEAFKQKLKELES